MIQDYTHPGRIPLSEHEYQVLLKEQSTEGKALVSAVQTVMSAFPVQPENNEQSAVLHTLQERCYAILRETARTDELLWYLTEAQPAEDVYSLCKPLRRLVNQFAEMSEDRFTVDADGVGAQLFAAVNPERLTFVLLIALTEMMLSAKDSGTVSFRAEVQDHRVVIRSEQCGESAELLTARPAADEMILTRFCNLYNAAFSRYSAPGMRGFTLDFPDASRPDTETVRSDRFIPQTGKFSVYRVMLSEVLPVADSPDDAEEDILL